MEPKKSKNADTERHRSTFLLFGIATALSLTLMAFSFKFNRPQIEIISEQVEEVDWDISPITIEIPEQKLEEPKEEIVVKRPTQINLTPVIAETEEPLIDIDSMLNALEKDIDALAASTKEKVVFVPAKVHESFEVDQQASFPGGEAAMFKFLSKVIHFPDLEKEIGLEGVAFVEFIINKNGKITKLKVLKSTTENFSTEALKGIKQMPNWEPAILNGKPVPVKFTLPVRFKLK